MRCSQKGCRKTAQDGYLTTLCRDCRDRIQTRTRILAAGVRLR